MQSQNQPSRRRGRLVALVLLIVFNWLFVISALPWLFFSGAMAGVLGDWSGRTALERAAATVLLILPLAAVSCAILGWRDFAAGRYGRSVLLGGVPIAAFIVTVASLRAWSP